MGWGESLSRRPVGGCDARSIDDRLSVDPLVDPDLEVLALRAALTRAVTLLDEAAPFVPEDRASWHRCHAEAQDERDRVHARSLEHLNADVARDAGRSPWA